MSERPRFHLAIPVDDLAEARAFYGGVLGCPEGRSSETWVDFDLRGHQLVVHLVESPASVRGAQIVDGDTVPVPHFGLLLDVDGWTDLTGRITAAGLGWVVEPTVRWEGAPGEQRTAFCLDPAGNALEFKCFADDAAIFAR